MKLGRTPTGTFVNFTRLCLTLMAIIAFVCSFIFVGLLIFSKAETIPMWRVYVAVGLFIGGVILIMASAAFSIPSHPWLLPNLIHTAMDKDKGIPEIESFLKTYKAQVGLAGFFNRLGFSGLSLGTVVSAFAILILGMIAIEIGIITKDKFSIFSDLAKLLFGAFVGSFAPAALPKNKGGKNNG